MSSRILVLASVLLVCAAPLAAAAGGRPVVVHGRSYASWTDYFLSPDFRVHEQRCGTPAPVRGSGGGIEALGNAADCSLDETNPLDAYAPGTIWEVTVVVHRFESTTGDGVFADWLVQSQIDVLNEDFRALPNTPGEPGADTRIQFRLATKDPQGNPHPGWTRTANDFWFNDLPDPVLGDYWDALAWDPTRYLNIYTLSPVAPGGLILGYVPYFPQEGAGGQDDGVRCLWSSFGRPSGNPPYHLGRTVTHEVGHWAGLLHVFQDGCGTAGKPGCYRTGDLVCDTEPDADSHGGCPVNSNTCGDPDPIRNYLEYTDDHCMNNFTPEQARRMRCTMQSYRPAAYQPLVVGVAQDLRSAPGASLAQNQPNPFVRTTEMRFDLPRDGTVSLAVHDLAGRRVRTLVAGTLSAGGHRVLWDGADDGGRAVEPGVYFYRLTTDAGSQTRRLVMLR